MKVELKYTKQALENHAIATGQVAHSQMEVPLEKLEPEERALVIAMTGVPVYHGHVRHITVRDPVFVVGATAFNAPFVPIAPKDWVALAHAWREADEANRQRLRDRLTAEASQLITEGEAALALWDADFVKAVEKNGYSDEVAYRFSWDANTEPYLAPELAARARDVAERIKARFTPLREAASKATSERNRQAEERERRRRQELEAEKATWIAAHGSDYLKKAVAAGYDCQRRYIEERADLEYPGYLVDFDEDSQYHARSAPSEAALDEALRVGGQVVWLPDQNCEAVRKVIAERYNLYKIYPAEY